MTKFVAKPITVEAVQLRSNNWEEMSAFLGGASVLSNTQRFKNVNGNLALIIPCGDEYIIADEGDWVLKRGDSIMVYLDEDFGKFWMRTEPGYKTRNHSSQHEYVCIRCGACKFFFGDSNIPDRIGCGACNKRVPYNNFIWMLPVDSPSFALKEAYRNAARRVR